LAASIAVVCFHNPAAGAVFMDNIEDFLKQAAECRVMAAKTSNETLRLKFTELALRWTELAEERKRFLKAAPATATFALL
jgi:hypothetical protein